MNYELEQLTRLEQLTENIIDQQTEAQAAASAVSGSAGQLVGYDTSGQLTSFTPAGDGNGFALQISGTQLQGTLAQDIKPTATPTFAGLTLSTGGTQVKKILSGTVSIDPGSIAAQTRGSQTFTVTGAAVGDIIILNPPGALNTGLVYAGVEVTGADTGTIYLGNLTAGAIDDSAQTWRYLWLDLT